MIAAALMLASITADPVAIRAGAVSSFLEYEHCLQNRAVVAGAFSDEDARGVVEAVEGQCAAEWQGFRMLLTAGREPSPRDRARLSQFRALALASASSELVAGRIGSCGTRSDRYPCGGAR